MPHISKQKLDSKTQVKLFKQLTSLCTAVSKKGTQDFLDNLLTDTEKLMLSKRLAAVIMLHEGYSQYAVEHTLALSSSTIAKIRTEYTSGKFDSICAAFSKQKHEKEEFWHTIEVLSRLGMPSMTGDRWKFLRTKKE